MRGLYFVVQPSGARSWAVRYRHEGRSRKHTIGSYPAIDLSNARTLGGKALRVAAEGRDPSHERQLARSVHPDSIAQIADQFIARYAKQNNRERTWRETERILRRDVLPRWKGKLIREITRRDILKLLDDTIDRGAPVIANRILAAVRKMFAWAVDRDIISLSPCAGIKAPTAERSRDRVLTDNELRLVWLASDKIGWPFGPIVKLLILTAQRRDEVVGMRWAELRLDERLWTLPRERVKNNRVHEVPLSDQAIQIIKALPVITGPLVFSTTGKSPFSGFSKAKRRLDAVIAEPLPHWQLHDLRRTVATGMARLGVVLPVVEKILNHSSGSFSGVAGVYQRHDYRDEKGKALDAWARSVQDLIGDPPPESRAGK
jgi:integrase